MANFFSRLLAKATFWDQEDDRRIEREDEEERRRKNIAAVAHREPIKFNFRQNDSQPEMQTQDLRVNIISPLRKKDPFIQELQKSSPQINIASQAKYNQMRREQESKVSDKQKELERLAADNLEEARERERKNSGFWERTFNGEAIEERAVAAARNKATTQFQDKYGWNADPEVLRFGDQTMRRLKKEGARLKAQRKSLDDTQQSMEKLIEGASNVPIVGSIPAGIVKLGSAAVEKGAELLGDKTYAKELGDSRLRAQLGISREDFDRLPKEKQDKLRLLQNIDLGTVPLDYIGIGSILKTPLMAGGKKLAKDMIMKKAVSDSTKELLRTGVKQTGKEMLIAGGSGAAISAGGQAWLNDGKVDAAAVVKDGVTGAMLGPIFGGGSTKNLRKAEHMADTKSISGVLRGEAEVIGKEAVDIGSGMKSVNKEIAAKPLRKAIANADEAVNEQAVKNGVKNTTVENSVPVVGTKSTPLHAPETGVPLKKAPAVAKVAKKSEDAVPVADFDDAVRADAAPEAIKVKPSVEGEQLPNAADPALRVSTKTDAEGNPVMVSDAQRAKEAAAAGEPIRQEASPTATAEEALAREAAEAAAEQVQGQEKPTRLRSEMSSKLTDEALKADILDGATRKERVSIDDSIATANSILRDLDDDALVSRYTDLADNVGIRDSTDFFVSVGAVKRLERIDTPEAKQAIARIFNQLDDYAEAHGRGLRTLRTIYEDMPSSMKANFLEKKAARAGRSLSDDQREMLLKHIEIADQASEKVRGLEGSLKAIMANIENGSLREEQLTPEVRKQIDGLMNKVSEAKRERDYLQGTAWSFFTNTLPPDRVGKRVANFARTMMLSAPSGRIFDMLSTGASSIDSALERGISGVLGKAVNKVLGKGTVKDVVFDRRSQWEGFKEGVHDFKDSWSGRKRVEDLSAEAKAATRGNISGKGVLGQKVSALVELPSHLTRGIRNEELYRSSLQKADKLGMTGQSREMYARIHSVLPTSEQLHEAEQAWKRVNMMHDNPVSRKLNNLANALDGESGLGAIFLRNQVIPFTSWAGGFLHRAVTDKFIPTNIYNTIRAAHRGDIQGVVDNISRLANNAAQAYALGYILSATGVLTNKDANGDSYAGLYLHIGDRYIPVSVLGTAAMPVVLGQGLHQFVETGDAEEAFGKTIENSLRVTGVSSTLGSSNNLQSAIDTATKKNGSAASGAAQYTGNLVRQYIPAAFTDANSVIDNIEGFNPTKEAAKTKETYVDPDSGREKTDHVATQVNKTIEKLPFASQALLERQEGKPARDFIDRTLKSNRETPEMAVKRETKESLQTEEKRLRKEGVPLKDEAIKDALRVGEFDKAVLGLEHKVRKLETDPTTTEARREYARDQLRQAELRRDGVPVSDEGIRARFEDGNFESAVRGLEYRLSKKVDSDDVPESTKQNMRNRLGRYKVYASGEFDPSVAHGYELDTKNGGVSVSEWRAMMRSGDPEMVRFAESLAALDQKLYENKLIRKLKYQMSGSRGGYGGGSRYRGGSRSGGGSDRIVTSIATNKLERTPMKQKVLPAVFGERHSATPKIARVPNNDKALMKKISVKRGRRLS